MIKFDKRSVFDDGLNKVGLFNKRDFEIVTTVIPLFEVS